MRKLATTGLCIALAAACTSVGAQQTVNIGALKVPADSPIARGEYPRLTLTRAQLPAIRARLDNPEIQTYVKQAEDLIRMKRADAFLLAALYQLTGEKQYAEAAKKKLGNPGWNPKWALTFDLVAETMTDAERADYARKLLAQVKANRWRPRLLHCLAAWGNGVDAELAPFVRPAYEHEVVRTLAYNNRWSRGRGGSSMGHGYNGEHFFSAEWDAIMGWSHATGQDMMTSADFATYQSAWYVYQYLPWQNGNRQVIRIGVTMSPSHVQALTPQKFGAENTVMLAITRNRDGLGQWWMRDFVANWPQPRWRKGEEHIYGLAGRLLWLDPAIPSVPPERFPETRLFPENGHVLMRSDWSADATVALFRCGRFGEIDGWNGRNNLDNLHFIIYRKGYLAPDTGCVHGVNEGTWKMGAPRNLANYGRQTIAHNSITVGRERYDVRSYNGTVMSSCERGGQIGAQKPEWFKAWGLDEKTAAANFKEGEITAYSTSPQYDYASGDATHSYPPERVKKITRQFVYLKPDLFVVFDRVTPADAKQEVIWNLHAYDRPAWDGKTEAVAGKAEHFAHTAGNVFRTENGNSAMLTTLLLPSEADRTVRTIGGRGHGFEINGVNIGPTDETYRLLDQRNGHGGLEGVAGWRIEVSPKEVNGEVHFLNVLQVGDAGSTFQPAQVTGINEADGAGARIVRGGDTWKVTFRTAGDTGGHITLTRDGGRVDEDLAAKIDDNYDRWKTDPRYTEWMTNDLMRTVIFPYGKKPGE